MKSTDIYKAFSLVDEDILDRSEKAAERRVIPLKRRVALAAAAVLVVAVLMGATAVVSDWESAKVWVAWRWQQMTGSVLSAEQREAVQNYSQEVGVCQTVDGVTITVDSAVIYDREMELLLRIDGIEDEKLENWMFEYFETKVNSTYQGGSRYGYVFDNGSYVMPISIGFDDLGDADTLDVSIYIKDIIEMGFRRRTVVEGEWNLEFTLNKSEFAKIKLPDTDITVEYMQDNNLLEELPQKIDKSCTENGITVTADSAKVRGGKFKLLVRVDGIEIPDEQRYHVNFDNIRITVDEKQCENFTFSCDTIEVLDGEFYVIFTGIPRGFLYQEPLKVTVEMTDFMAHELTGELIAEGKWEIDLNLRLDTAGDMDDEKIKTMPLTITDLELSDVGFAFKAQYEFERYTINNGTFIEHKSILMHEIYAVCEDGTKIECDASHGSSTTEGVGDIVYCEWYIEWPAPIDVDEVVEIHIGDTVIPVK